MNRSQCAANVLLRTRPSTVASNHVNATVYCAENNCNIFPELAVNKIKYTYCTKISRIRIFILIESFLLENRERIDYISSYKRKCFRAQLGLGWIKCDYLKWACLAVLQVRNFEGFYANV